MSVDYLSYIRGEVDNNTISINQGYVTGLFVSNEKVHNILDELIQERYIVVPNYVFKFFWRQDKKGYNFRTNPDYTLRLMLGPSAVRLGEKDNELKKVVRWVRANPVKYVEITKLGCVTEDMRR